jgi:HEAT repeat protein
VNLAILSASEASCCRSGDVLVILTARANGSAGRSFQAVPRAGLYRRVNNVAGNPQLGRTRRRAIAVSALLAALASGYVVLATPTSPGAEVEIDSARRQDPKIEIPSPNVAFSPTLKPLWLEALARPEADLKRQAAQTIAMAHRRGMSDLGDTAPALVEAMDAPDQAPVVVLAAAEALVTLDARQTAPVLLKHAVRDGLDVAQIVEPALARWDYEPARKLWLDRLSEPRPPRRLLVLAIRGVAVVGEERAEPRLREMAMASDVAPDLRLEAARALGKLRTEGLEEDARKLAADRSAERIVDRLVAASLLGGHRGKAAEALLSELALDPEPSVAAIALERLLEIDPMLVVPIAEPTIANDDANVRRLGARALVAWHTPEAIGLLGPMLDDPHPKVRSYVRRSLVKLASEAKLAQPVIEAGVEMLAGERWRGLEQATILLVALDHKPATGRLVELLEFERPEVFVAAAWGLRRLAVPATLEAMFDKARRETEKIEAAGSLDSGRSDQLCQLIEAFGQMKYAPSDPLLRRYIPKRSPFGEPARAAAIWTLGHLHAGQPEPELVKLFAGRLSDLDPMFPEVFEVRLMSAVSLGRMRAEAALPTLRQFLEQESPETPIGYACGWAIHQITGEPIPKPVIPDAYRMGWFLEPVGE